MNWSLFSLISLLIVFQSFANEADEPYYLAAGDKLRISVYLEPDLSVNTQISQTGHIDFPLLGRVELSGLSLKQAKQRLEEMLEDGYLVAPSVNLVINQYRPFFIYGEVNKPGSYDYQPGITVEQVIALAGGLKDRASRSKWNILRGEIDKKEIQVTAETKVAPGDIIKIEKSFF